MTAYDDARALGMPSPAEHHDTAQDFDTEPDDGPGWVDGRIANLRGMEEAGRKVVEAEAQIALNDAAAEAEQAALLAKLEAVTARLETANAPFERRAARYRGFMLGFMDQNRAEVLRGLPAKTKSRTLVCGLMVAYRKEGGHLRLRESPTARAQLIAWAQINCPEATEQRWEVDVQAVKRAIGKATIPDGMERVPESESLTVTTKGDGK